MHDDIHPSLKRFKRTKVLALYIAAGLLGTLIWSVFAGKDRELFVPIEIGALSPGLTLADTPLREVEVLVHGPNYRIKNLSEAAYRYAINPADMHRGIHRIQLRGDRFGFPEGISIVRISPPVVILKVEKEIRKRVPVMVSLSGKPAAGYRIADAVARPSSVLLIGPESLIQPLSKVMTKSMDITGLSQSLKKEIALDLADNLSVEPSSEMLHGEIYIEEKIVTKKISDITVQGTGTDRTHTITPLTIHIEISGPMKALESMDAGEDVRAYVDLKGLEPGVYVRPVAISLPLKTTLVSVSPEVFSISIE